MDSNGYLKIARDRLYGLLSVTDRAGRLFVKHVLQMRFMTKFLKLHAT